jgi:Alginate export
MTRMIVVGLGALALVLGAGPGRAIELLQEGGLSVEAGLEVGAAYLHTENTNFGAGRVDLHSGDNSGDAQWGEGYLKPSLDLSYETEAAGTVYGGASAVGALTVGDGDAGGFTDGGDKQLDVEGLFAGWRSGSLFADSLGEDGLDLSLGRQDFHVGDGFLIWDGNFDTAGDGAYWLAPRSAFKMTGLVRLKKDPLSSQLFYLEADGDQGDTQAVGVNLDYQPGFGTIGATYLQILDANASFEADTPREGMQVAALRLNEAHLPDFEDASLNAEYVQEFGDGDHTDFHAYAFYVEPAYTFSWLPWTPTLAYRFAYFSGDPDSSDDQRKDFDPLFYEGDRAWGAWTQGEIVGNYLLFNSNQVNHMVQLSAYPIEEVGIGVIYYHFDLEEKNYFGTPVGERDFADEVDVYADWTVTDNLTVGALYGVAFPGDAAKEAFGANDPFHLFEVYATLTF